MLQTERNQSIGKQLAQEFLDEIRDELDDLLVKLSAYHTKNQGAPGAVLTMLLQKFQRLAAHGSASHFTLIEKNVVEFNRALAGFNQLGTGELDIVINGLEVLRRLVEEQASNPNTGITENPTINTLAQLTPPPPKHLLLICNERSLSRIIGRTLNQLGYEVRFASDSSDIKGMIDLYSPTFIICNATMGEFSGVDIIQNLKQIKAYQAIPMAILTSYDVSHPIFSNLPENTPILRKGENFTEDFRQALQKFSL